MASLWLFFLPSVSFIGRVARYTHSSTASLKANIAQQSDKANEKNAPKRHHDIKGHEAQVLFDAQGVTPFLVKHYEVLHTQSAEQIAYEVERFLQHKTITQ